MHACMAAGQSTPAWAVLSPGLPRSWLQIWAGLRSLWPGRQL
jgi:hypothetical protein